jgi:hypothetical protein
LVSDFLKVVNELTVDETPDSATDYLLTYDADASAPKKILIQSLPSTAPRGYIAGCIVSNGTDTTNDINVSAGVCRDGTNTVDITVSAMTGKQLDANWAPGSGAGMRNSAAGIADATYHIYAVSTAAGVQDIYAYAGVAGTDPDSSASISAVITALQAESGGADYIYARRIDSILRQSSSIIQVIRTGDIVTLKTPILDISTTSPGTSAITAAVSVPSGLRALAAFNIFGAFNLSGVYLSSPDSVDLAPSTSAAPDKRERRRHAKTWYEREPDHEIRRQQLPRRC